MPGGQKIPRISTKTLESLVLNNLHLELASDQENKSGFASEGLWFLGHSVELACVETPPPLKKIGKRDVCQ